MKRLCLLIPGVIGHSKLEQIVESVQILKNETHYEVAGLVETLTSKELLLKYSPIGPVFSFNDELLGQAKFDNPDKNELLARYDRYNLQRLRIDTAFVEGALFAPSSGQSFSVSLVQHLAVFEKLLSVNHIDIMCLAFNEAYSSSFISILDAVCEELMIKKIYITHPFHRIMITDNMWRLSPDLDTTYKEIIRRGISKREEEVLTTTASAYKKFKNSQTWEQKYRSNSYGNIINEDVASRIFGYFISIKNKSYRKVVKWLLDSKLVGRPWITEPSINHPLQHNFSKVKYVLLLLNKNKNYRTTLLSPYYSDVRSVIRNISVSLPTSHVLLVRNHPGNKHYQNWLARVEAKKLGNVIFDDARLDIYETIEHSDMVFAVASSSVLDALIMNKHTISFGNKTLFVSGQDNPVSLMKRWDELPALIASCIETKMDPFFSKAFILAFLLTTRSMSIPIDKPDWVDEDFNIEDPPLWYDPQMKPWCIAAHCLAKHINTDSTV